MIFLFNSEYYDKYVIERRLDSGFKENGRSSINRQSMNLLLSRPQARGEVPRLPNGLPEKSSRLDRPRARDRPKPRRRPRPKEPGETTRRSRSAPAQSSQATPQPPTHTAHHEGFLFRKLDIESMKKSTNRWVFRARRAASTRRMLPAVMTIQINELQFPNSQKFSLSFNYKWLEYFKSLLALIIPVVLIDQSMATGRKFSMQSYDFCI